VQVALFGLVLLGDVVTPLMALAILVATSGVVLTGLRPGASGGLQATLLGLASAAMFGLSAIGYRGAILSLDLASYLMAATFTMTVGLLVQVMVLTVYLVMRDPKTIRAILEAWKPSLLAGFLGAFASQFWFLAFALTSAANVRTLALIEVLFAQGISRFVFGQATTQREACGIALVVVGVALLLWAH
jgi:drug/metabolite transporter (DMT)-like permease